MSENLMDSIAPHLAPPVSREPIRSAAELEDGADVMSCTGQLFSIQCTTFFADEDA